MAQRSQSSGGDVHVSLELAAQRRARARWRIDSALTALASAGTLLLLAREDISEDGQPLLDALRDDTAKMIGDVQTLRTVVMGR